MRFCIGNVSTDFELRMNISYQTMTRKVESGQRLRKSDCLNKIIGPIGCVRGKRCSTPRCIDRDL